MDLYDEEFVEALLLNAGSIGEGCFEIVWWEIMKSRFVPLSLDRFPFPIYERSRRGDVYPYTVHEISWCGDVYHTNRPSVWKDDKWCL